MYKKQKNRITAVSFFCFVSRNYSSTGAPTGHADAQAPQEIQASVILKAMVLPPHIYVIF